MPVANPTPDANDRIADYTRTLDWVTGALAFLALIQLWFVRKADKTARISADAATAAANATRLSVEKMDQIAQRQLRAYVGITHAEIVPRNGKDALLLTFKNSGHTPAYDFHSWIASHIREMPLVEPLETMPEEEYARTWRFPVGPGATTEKHIVLPPQTPEATRDIKAGIAAVYFYGRGDYRDAFGNDRWFQYCYYLTDEEPRKLVLYTAGNTST